MLVIIIPKKVTNYNFNNDEWVKNKIYLRFVENEKPKNEGMYLANFTIFIL